MTRCVSRRMAASSSTSASGGRPPADSPTLIAPAARVEAQAERMRGLDRVVEAAAVRIQVEVIARGRAAGQHELGHRHLRRHVQHLGREARPHRVQRAQPREELGILRGGQRPRQRLEEVMVRVDEARAARTMPRQSMTSSAAVGRVSAAPTPAMRWPSHQHPAVGDLAARRIHRRDDRRIAEQQRAFAQHVRHCTRAGSSASCGSARPRCDNAIRSRSPPVPAHAL